METFSALLAICAGNSPITGEFAAQRPVARSFDVFFDLCLNKRLSKQSWCWWFETSSRPLWRRSNVDSNNFLALMNHRGQIDNYLVGLPGDQQHYFLKWIQHDQAEVRLVISESTPCTCPVCDMAYEFPLHRKKTIFRHSMWFIIFTPALSGRRGIVVCSSLCP